MDICEDIWSQIFIYLDIHDIKNLMIVYPCFNSIVNVKLNWINKFKYENKEKYTKYLINHNNDFMRFYEALNNMDITIRSIIERTDDKYDNSRVLVDINKNTSIDDINSLSKMMQRRSSFKELINEIQSDVLQIVMCMASSNAVCYYKYKGIVDGPIGKIESENYYNLFELLILNNSFSIEYKY